MNKSGELDKNDTVSNGVKKTALLASYAKDGPLLRLGKMLAEAGWDLMGSAGTAK
ncbi:MAG: hypothetical protein AAB927_04035 [Patescibacteria group bacterium]